MNRNILSWCLIKGHYSLNYSIEQNFITLLINKNMILKEVELQKKKKISLRFWSWTKKKKKGGGAFVKILKLNCKKKKKKAFVNLEITMLKD